MRTKHFILFQLVFLLLLASCHSDKKQEGNLYPLTIHVDNIDDAEDIEVTKDKYIKSFRCIQLETDTTVLIGSVIKVLYEDNRIYITDRNGKNVFIFDGEGNFINKIYRYGQGPEEYTYVRDIFYDSREKTINLLAHGGSSKTKIMAFDADGKELLKQTPIDLYLHEAMKSDEGFLICNSQQSVNDSSAFNRLTVFSEDFKKLYDAVPILPQWRNQGGGPAELHKSKDGKIYCCPDNTRDVYEVTRDSAFLKYRFDFGKYNFPDEYNNPERIREKPMGHVMALRDFYETENYIASVFLFNGQEHLSLYNKATAETETYSLSDNPILPEFRFGFFCGISNNRLISELSPASVLGNLENPNLSKKEIEEYKKHLKEQFKKPLHEDDNPILCIYEFAFQ